MIALLVALACVALVLSLPIAATKAGAQLRRAALLLFLLALTPALCRGLVRAFEPGAAQTSAPAGPELFLALVILSPLAYAILRVRQALRRKNRDAWAEFVDRKATGKKLVDPRAANQAQPPDPFDPFGGQP